MGLTNKGIDAKRRSLTRANVITEEIRDLQTVNPAAVLYRAVVTEIFFDPTSLTPEDVTALKDAVSNPTAADNIPRNSVLVRVISGGQDRRAGLPLICYPFFSPHLSLPVKPGEQVWIIFENPNASHGLGYWIGRIPEPEHVDDLCYTHNDRKFDPEIVKTTSEKASGQIKAPSFLNGAGTPDTQTLSGSPDEYDRIFKSAKSSRGMTLESVPRFSKRPGDAVFQGSNNTLICLGEERAGSSSKEKSTPQAGAIDIVAGRGRFGPPAGQEPKGAQARSIKNSRGWEETDKNPALNSKGSNKTEGDPDFVADAARFYLSMKCDGDEKFQITANKLPKLFSGTLKDVKGSSFAVVKADEVRIVSRQDKEHSVDGSIRLIKEGASGGDQCSILMLPGGDVQIDGNKIYIGRLKGSAEDEPYIKYSEYKKFLEDLFAKLDIFLVALAAAFVVPSPPVVGGPHPGLNTGGKIAVESLRKDLGALKSTIPLVRSGRIFGE